MKDATIIRMLEETCAMLKNVDAYVSCAHLAPSYNAMLVAAQANHPDDLFLSVLPPLPIRNKEEGHSKEGCGSSEIRVLFAQMRIALESLQNEPERALTVPGRSYPV